MVTGTNAGGQTKRDNEQSLEMWKPPTPEKTSTIMHGSILLVTMPPPPRHTPRSLQFVSFLEVYPPATNSCTSFLSIQKQNDTFSQLLWTFSRVYWEKDNGCQNVVKTATKNLEMKTKKKNPKKKCLLDKTTSNNSQSQARRAGLVPGVAWEAGLRGGEGRGGMVTSKIESCMRKT